MIMGLRNSLLSFVSMKKLMYKHVSITAIWDNESSFTKYTHLLRGCRLSKSHVGKYSRVGINTKLTNVTVGNYSCIGSNSSIGVGQHPTNYLTYHSIFYKKGNWGWHDDWIKYPDGFMENAQITIGHNVWIGQKVVIMDGVNIGDNSIIATGAIVTKNVPPFSIVGGVPAKVIRTMFDEKMRARLLEIQWWNLSDDDITKVIDLFHIPNPTIDDINKYFPENT